MKVLIQNQKTGETETQHLDSTHARALIAAGIAVEAPAEVKKQPTITKWFVRRGAAVEDWTDKPELIHTCSTCTHLVNGRTTLSGSESHLHKMRHCGMVESCPQDVQQQYVKLRQAWERKQPKAALTSQAPAAPKGYEPHPTLPNCFVRMGIELVRE